MALDFFRQRDIERMDVNDIPETFINYVRSLDAQAQAALLGTRPDLAAALGVALPDTDADEALKTADLADNGLEGTGFADGEAPEITPKVIPDAGTVSADEENPLPEDKTDQPEGADKADKENQPGRADATAGDAAEPISRSIYEGKDLHRVLTDNMRPLEALAIPDGSKNCAVHHIPFEKVQIQYTQGSIYKMVLRVCSQCQRVFMEASSMRIIDRELKKRNIPHIFYDRETTGRYLSRQIKPHEMKAEEKLYVPEAWIEEKPTCPIHNTPLYRIPCTRSYKDRRVSFTGFLCDQCGRILIRKAHAIELEDLCARSGVPVMETEPLVRRKPEKSPVPPRKVKPDFIIENGKKSPYEYGYTAEWYELTEEDTVVVSDTIYCSLDGHDTGEILALIRVREKKGARRVYLFMLGYCGQCRKYYMDLTDYRAVYQIGRPEVRIIRDFEDTEYQITSGEVFNLERDHLDALEEQIDASIRKITGSRDYVSPYATGDYDDGGLRYAKSVSSTRYGKRLNELSAYASKPYRYRVDITAGDDTERYYIGAQDVVLDGHRHVISANSSFGHDLINYQTLKIRKDGREYGIKLSREFDIDHAQLYGYLNLRTDEDVIFKSGITDPFLVRVLNMRRKQHELTDIFVTIQENQNEIVNADFRENIVVQGCAGSGKTMVLLHRLSSLAYKHKSFDFGRYAMILTPNDRFSDHIKGLAEGLQINHIERVCVEQYYMDMLVRYDPAFKPDTGIVTETAVPQNYVNFIYSDSFRNRLDQAFEKVIGARNALGELLYSVSDAMGQKRPDLHFDDIPGVMQQMRFGAEALNGMVNRQERAAADAQEKLDRLRSRRQFLEEKVPEAKKAAGEIVQEAVSRLTGKLREYEAQKQQETEALEETLREYRVQREKVRRSINPFGRQNRLDTLDQQMAETERKLGAAGRRAERVRTLLKKHPAGRPDEDAISWMRDISKYVRDAQDEIRRCNMAKEDYVRFTEELRGMDAGLQEAQEELQKAKDDTFGEDITKTLRDLTEQIDQYTLRNTCQMVFDEATADFRKEHKIKNISGKYHRYDLYAQLLFAMKYFNGAHGDIRYMCVDEGQDLSFNEYRLIYELNRKNLIFNIFGDTNQLMKPGRGIDDWAQLKKVLHAREYVLNENYRNTNQITGFCNSSFDMHVLQTGADGPAVQEIPRQDLEERLSALDITSERIAVLLPRTVRKKQYLHMDKIAEPVRNLIGDTTAQGHAALMYVDEVKGIEFDKVFVAADDMGRNERYIAYTRALTELILVVDDILA